LEVLKISATMARQEGWVQLKQSDMHLALNMAKMAKVGYSRASIEEIQQLINRPHIEVREGKKRGVELPGHNKVKSAIERHLEIVCKTQMGGVVGKSISHHHRHSAWQRTAAWCLYEDTGMMETDWATGAYGDERWWRWTE
jgi:hypothetical protein